MAFLCVRQPAVEAQDRVAAGVTGPVSRRDLWVGVWCGVYCVGPGSPEWAAGAGTLCVSITYRPIEGACFCGPVSAAYRGSVRTGRLGRSATGARGVSDHASETGVGSGRRSRRSGSTGPRGAWLSSCLLGGDQLLFCVVLRSGERGRFRFRDAAEERPAGENHA